MVIINEAFVRKYWPNEDPIGKRIIIAKGLGAEFEEPERQIIGIVGSVMESGIGNGAADRNGSASMVPVMYVPQAQITDALTKLAGSLLPMSWVIRTSADPLSVASAVRQEFESLDATLAPTQIRTMDQVIAEASARQNFNALLLTVFACLALVLAAVGIYGLMSYSVEQRTQEIGIRIAMGANQSKIMKMILGQGARLAVIGTVIGLAAAYGLIRVLGKFFFAIKANDPLAFLVVAVVLVAVALLAGLVPTRRAMRVDPITALRQE